MDDLTLPGSIPGLLRRGSPVLLLDGIDGPVWSHMPPAAVSELRESGTYAWVAAGRYCDGFVTGMLALDLTDATGRAHAAWWLASQVRHVTPSLLDPGEGTRWHRSWRGYWELHCQRADEHKRWQEVAFLRSEGDDDTSDRIGGPHSTWCRHVPALATLDPSNPRLLPDGSRWVDAEALRLVCLHVAGRGVTRG